MRYYDPSNERLVYFGRKANAFFWENHWQKHDLQNVLTFPPQNRFVVNTTSKYLPLGSKIIEGGCGMGDKSYALHKTGFDAYGIDITENTIKIIHKAWPELKIVAGDVRKLPFERDFFDGYWSCGVIEHFYNGYAEILQEMARIIRRQGYLFLTFPAMSFLRKIKIKKGGYAFFEETKIDLNGFYQFVLDPEKVKNDFKECGFEIVEEQWQAGLKGLKDEMIFLKSFLQKIHDGSSIFSKSIHKGLNLFLSRWTGHAIFIVLQKK